MLFPPFKRAPPIQKQQSVGQQSVTNQPPTSRLGSHWVLLSPGTSTPFHNLLEQQLKIWSLFSQGSKVEIIENRQHEVVGFILECRIMVIFNLDEHKATINISVHSLRSTRALPSREGYDSVEKRKSLDKQIFMTKGYESFKLNIACSLPVELLYPSNIFDFDDRLNALVLVARRESRRKAMYRHRLPPVVQQVSGKKSKIHPLVVVGHVQVSNLARAVNEQSFDLRYICN